MFQYGPLGRFARGFLRLFSHKYTCSGFPPEDMPVIYISRHQKFDGMYRGMLHMDRYPRPWVLAKLVDSNACTKHMREYTLTVRYRLPMWLAMPVGWVYGHVLGATFRSIGAIPVGRGNREIINTFHLSIEALQRGESVVIFPDVDILDNTPDSVELYEGFATLAQWAWKKTGKNYPFVPLYTSRKQHQVLAGFPVYMDMTLPREQQRGDVVQKLKDCFHHMAMAAGDLPQERGA